jgi:hypothetical protein
MRFVVKNSPFSFLPSFDIHAGYVWDVRLPLGSSSGLYSFWIDALKLPTLATVSHISLFYVSLKTLLVAHLILPRLSGSVSRFLITATFDWYFNYMCKSRYLVESVNECTHHLISRKPVCFVTWLRMECSQILE